MLFELLLVAKVDSKLVAFASFFCGFFSREIAIRSDFESEMTSLISDNLSSMASDSLINSSALL
ncbi:MAG: hypothetical protein P8J69_00975 [Flavobacteriaceae bacterium]|nr:hypothetical protein [Flavobacteriaceae bacterium]